MDGEAVTHAELDDASGRVAAWLATRVQPGDRVLLAAGSSVGFVRCYLGALRAGAVVVLANPGYTAAELGHLVADSGAVLAFADSEPARRLAGLGQGPALATADVRELPGQARPATGIAARPHDTALLAYTSGTTGRPKGVPLTHRQLTVSIRAAMAAWQWHADDVLVHASACSWLAHTARRRSSRIDRDRACASSPSASARRIADGASAARPAASQRTSEVRFTKSRTPRPEANRALRAVGSTWLGPAM